MLYQISHSFVGFLFQTSFQRWHFQSLFHSRQAVVFQWRDVALKCCWLTTSNSGGQMKDHYKVWISQVNSMLLLFIPGNQSWPQNFCPKDEMPQQCGRSCRLSSSDYCITFTRTFTKLQYCVQVSRTERTEKLATLLIQLATLSESIPSLPAQAKFSSTSIGFLLN